MGEWESRPIEELVALVSSGGTPRAGDPRYYAEVGTPFLKIDDITKSRGRFVKRAEQSITDVALNESAAKVFPAGTVLVTMYGTMGVTKTLLYPMATNQAIAALVPPFRCDPDYLAHALSFRRAGLERLAAQTTQPNISGTIVRRFKLPIPPKEEQRRIAEILDTIDETIQAIQLVIAKRRALRTGLASDLLKSPDEGKLQRLGDLAEILDSHRVPVREEDRPNGSVPYYGANGQQGWIDRPLFNEPLILLAEDGGHFDDYADRPIAYRIDGPAWVNNHAHVLRAAAGVDQSYLFWSLRNRDIRRWIAGGTRSKLTRGAMEQIAVPIPGLTEQRQIAEILDKVVLRKLVGSDGCEEFPVGFSGVEECSDSVVVEVPKTECCSFDPFDQVVQSLGGSVRHFRVMPVGDLGGPPADGPSQAVHLWRE